ncbi:tetratricopeptide repeat protein [Methanolobus halotolerans]|nr:tetratricopeptide repeat protein [Methanolobus halotolerans]
MGMMDEVKTKKKLKAAKTWFEMAENARTPDKQIEYYTKSLDANPYNAEAWFRRGRVMEKMGRFNDAQSSFDHAVEIDPDYQDMIGKKTDSLEPLISSGENHDISEVTIADDTYSEAETYEELVTDNPENEETVFTPPTGDESIFSSRSSNQEEENKDDTTFFGEATENSRFSQATSQEAGHEVTFAAVSGVKVEREEEEEEEVAASFSDTGENTENIITSDTRPETACEQALREQTAHPAREEIREIEGTGSDRSHSNNITSFEAGESDVSKNVDIRIPLNETIKFWIVGIVAILIAFKLLELI